MNMDRSSGAASMEKRALRVQVRAAIARMSASERRRCDRAIEASLTQFVSNLGPTTVLGYFALADEVRLDGFLARMVAEGHTVCLPRVAQDGLAIRRWRPTTILSKDREGVFSPIGVEQSVEMGESGAGQAASGRAKPLVVLPGRAFDSGGRRLGRGGGYYDRLLHTLVGRCLVVGVGYEAQIVEHVPQEAHDAPVDWIVTEHRCDRAISQ